MILFLIDTVKFLTSGKVKDLYDPGGDALVFKFSDRVSAFDVKFRENIPRKGEVLCKFAEFWFNELPIPNHFVKRQSETEITVKKMKMLPIECVVRGYFYGSFASRWKKGARFWQEEASLYGHESTRNRRRRLPWDSPLQKAP